MHYRWPQDARILVVSTMRRLIVFFATAAYAGFVPVTPGTAGSLVGLIVAWAVFGGLCRISGQIALLAFAVLFASACWISGRAEEIFGEPDSPHIVIDEVFGMVATMFMNPVDLVHLVVGFALFRLFDITKPFPAGLIERRVRGGAGVMLDDLAAAIYANIALRILARLV